VFTLSGRDIIRRCELLASLSEEPGFTTRTFLSRPMHDVHAHLTGWMTELGMNVRIDAAGNLRGVYQATSPTAPRLFIGSHLDTVPRAGAFDGVLGVVLGIALVERLNRARFPFAIEVIGFSEEEGVRFSAPFIGSRAFVGTLDDTLLSRRDAAGRTVYEAIVDYGLDPRTIGDAVAGESIGYLEFHIEQGPVLDNLRVALGVVDAISGQTRAEATFVGAAGHAGTTPMKARRDALACAAEWIGAVEREASATPGLAATVGSIAASPGAANVIAGVATATLDVRHADDRVRTNAANRLASLARDIAARREIDLSWRWGLDQAAVVMDPTLVGKLERAVDRAGVPVHRLSSGAGHDAMVVAQRMPTAMLFIRSPGGISHHPDESVFDSDVAMALEVGRNFLDELA
jgi:allantoate deiminase